MNHAPPTVHLDFTSAESGVRDIDECDDSLTASHFLLPPQLTVFRRIAEKHLRRLEFPPLIRQNRFRSPATPQAWSGNALSVVG
jgi:hypothetical protein